MADRVVALAPSVAVTIRAMGATDRLVAEVGNESGPTPTVGEWLTPDLEKVIDLEPDLVITTDDLQEPIAEQLRDRDLPVRHFAPRRLEDVVHTVREIGAAIGASEAGANCADRMQNRIATFENRELAEPVPTVYCEEWPDPPMVAGNWVPELVEIAGGRYPFRMPGERSGEIDRETVESAAPSVVVLHYCGQGTDVDPARFSNRQWNIPAVQNDQIVVVSDGMLNQPSPKLMTGLARLRTVIEGVSLDDSSPQ